MGGRSQERDRTKGQVNTNSIGTNRCVTKFKWMGNKSLDLVARGYDASYAFEEAIGYMFGDIVRDKDGIAAATVFLSLVVEIYGRNQKINELLIQLYEK